MLDHLYISVMQYNLKVLWAIQNQKTFYQFSKMKWNLFLTVCAIVICECLTTTIHHDNTNTTLHGNATPGNQTYPHDNSHNGHGGGIHVISFNFAYVEQPFIIFSFLLLAGVAKLGKS